MKFHTETYKCLDKKLGVTHEVQLLKRASDLILIYSYIIHISISNKCDKTNLMFFFFLIKTELINIYLIMYLICFQLANIINTIHMFV